MCVEYPTFLIIILLSSDSNIMTRSSVTWKNGGRRYSISKSVAPYGMRIRETRFKNQVVQSVEKRISRGSENIQYAVGNAVNIATLGTGGGQLVHLTSLAQGDDEAGRTGNTVILKKLAFRFYLSGSNTSAQATANPKVRVIMFRQDCPLGTVLTSATSLFANIATNADALMEPLPQWNRRQKLFKIMYDKVFTLRTSGAGLSTAGASTDYVTAETGVQKIVKRWKKGLEITYAGAAGTTIQTNAIYVAFLPQTTAQYVNYFGRIEYNE